MDFKNYETPEQLLKRITIERLNEAMNADASQNKKVYCTQMKNYIRLMKPYMTKEVIAKLEETHDKMETDIKALRESNVSPADKEKQIVERMYETFDTYMVYGIDALQNSKIIQKQVEGILLSGKTVPEMLALGEKIRNSKAIAEVVEHESEESGQIQEGEGA